MTNFIKESGKNRVKNWANMKKAKIMCKRINTEGEQVFLRGRGFYLLPPLTPFKYSSTKFL